MNKAFSLALAIAAGALGMSCGGGDDDVGLGTSADDGGVEAHAGGSAGAGAIHWAAPSFAGPPLVRSALAG